MKSSSKLEKFKNVSLKNNTQEIIGGFRVCVFGMNVWDNSYGRGERWIWQRDEKNCNCTL